MGKVDHQKKGGRLGKKKRPHLSGGKEGRGENCNPSQRGRKRGGESQKSKAGSEETSTSSSPKGRGEKWDMQWGGRRKKDESFSGEKGFMLDMN